MSVRTTTILQQHVEEILADAQPRLVFVCAWCPDRVEQTRAARAAGFEVTHGICPACELKFEAEDARRTA